MPTTSPPHSDEDAARRLDEPLLRSLDMLLTETSVSRAAAKLGIAQSALSRHLKTLRQLTGDELLVRVGNRMVLTERAQSLAAPVKRILADMSLITSEALALLPHELRLSFRIATYDFLPKRFFAELVERINRKAPNCDLVICGLGSHFAHYRQLADREVDVVITIWPELPAHLRAASLLTEPMVCVMRQDHPLASGHMTLDDFQRARHLVSLEHVPGQGTVIEAQLAELGIRIQPAMHTQFLSLAPSILARTDLIFSTGRLLAEDFTIGQPLAIVPFPAEIKPHRFRLVWHERTHKNRALRWLRNEITEVARELAQRPKAITGVS
ncbi:LysR family transcriptional regulator [Corticibacter populi]|nr:LysR family transcriptional regulator [Corticibacter populi]RZS30968.1 DNA-binding transcriptional LysR family regulator [Corticibacter populi]